MMAFVEIGATAPLNIDCHYNWGWPDAGQHELVRTPVSFGTMIGPFDLDWPFHLILDGGGPSLPTDRLPCTSRLLPRTCRR